MSLGCHLRRSNTILAIGHLAQRKEGGWAGHYEQIFSMACQLLIKLEMYNSTLGVREMFCEGL